MNSADNLKKCITELFRSGEDKNHTADEMEKLLNGIDYSLLLQALSTKWVPLFEYYVDSNLKTGFAFHGPELVPYRCVLLYTNTVFCAYDGALHEQAYELWLMTSSRFVVVSRVCTSVNNNESVIEYRKIKSMDWWDTDITMDFPFLADYLKHLCNVEKKRKLPANK